MLKNKKKYHDSAEVKGISVLESNNNMTHKHTYVIYT